MNTLTIVFNKSRTQVLMRYTDDKCAPTFIGGKVNNVESPIDASYRELYDKTGITKDMIELSFVRHESVTTGYGEIWSLYVTAGILDEDIVISSGNLEWVDITDKTAFLEAFNYGNCFVFLREAIKILSK